MFQIQYKYGHWTDWKFEDVFIPPVGTTVVLPNSDGMKLEYVVLSVRYDPTNQSAVVFVDDL